MLAVGTREEYSGEVEGTKVALATMTKNPVDFEVWLRYHLDKFSHIFLRVEDTPHLKHVIDKVDHRGKLTVEYVDGVDNKDSYYTQQDRQEQFVNKCAQMALQMGIDFILHIDDDELFLLRNNHRNISSLISKLKIPSHISNLSFRNVEAVYPKDKGSCFASTKFIDCVKGDCKSYGNGKSMGKVSNNLKVYDPHLFKGPSLDVPIEEAVVLHFDSCTYERWYSKFKNLSNISDKKMNDIPFDFYKESIRSLKKCEDDCEKVGRDLFHKYKVEPYYKEKGLLNLDPFNLFHSP